MPVYPVNTHDLILIAAFVESGFIIGFIAMAVINHTADPSIAAAKWLKFLTYFIIVHVMIGAALAGAAWFCGTTALIIAFGAVEFVRVVRGKPGSSLSIKTLSAAVFILAAAGTFYFALISSIPHLIFVYVIVATLDAYSQLSGQLLGHHRLAPKISPNKTIEGAIGGTLVALLASVTLRTMAQAGWLIALAIGLSLCAAGITGDLAASWFKRRNGLKDFSSFLPGQGGFIDRFNSYFFAAPVFLIISIFMN